MSGPLPGTPSGHTHTQVWGYVYPYSMDTIRAYTYSGMGLCISLFQGHHQGIHILRYGIMYIPIPGTPSGHKGFMYIPLPGTPSGHTHTQVVGM